MEGPAAVVTAGWEERELEDQELREHIGRDLINLRLYWRTEELFQRDPELKQALLERHDSLRRLHTVHQMRLRHQLKCARELMHHPGSALLMDPERDSAIAGLQDLDEHHLRRVREVHAEFEQRWRPWERHHLAEQREQLRQALRPMGALLIAGGHVAFLTNRLRLFGLLELVPKPVVAWSAGAMALSERIVLFHDSPPQGVGNPEILEHGLGYCRGIIPLPHANRRLKLEDPVRVQLFARRFAPSRCITLDETEFVRFESGQLHSSGGARELQADGQVTEVTQP